MRLISEQRDWMLPQTHSTVSQEMHSILLHFTSHHILFLISSHLICLWSVCLGGEKAGSDSSDFLWMKKRGANESVFIINIVCLLNYPLSVRCSDFSLLALLCIQEGIQAVVCRVQYTAQHAFVLNTEHSISSLNGMNMNKCKIGWDINHSLEKKIFLFTAADLYRSLAIYLFFVLLNIHFHSSSTIAHFNINIWQQYSLAS